MARFLPVVSSSMVALKFNRDTRRLYVQFGEDSFYEYSNIPDDVILDVLFGGDSIGVTFNEFVKKGGFSFRKVTAVEANA